MHKFFAMRTNVLRGLLLVALAVITIRLFQIQVVQHAFYVEKAAEQQTMQTTIVAKRGEIYLLDGEEPVVVALNSKVWTVIVDPQTAKSEAEEVEKKIREHAGGYVTADFGDVFASSVLRYYVVARDVPYSVAQKIQNEELPGVWMQGTTKRVYPEGKLAANVLGFVNSDGIGQYGIEGAKNDVLTGKNGVLKTVKDVNNIPLTIGNENVKKPAQDGEDVVLAIDRNIQYMAEKALREVAEEFKLSEKGGASAIVMDPATGRILAMAQTPTYDPADYGSVVSADVYQIDATMSLYEPASVCKTLAFAAAIDQGMMTPETTFYNTGMTVVDGWPIHNATSGYYGDITMQTALDWSLNTGSTQALRLLGGSALEITNLGKRRLFDYYYNRFNLGHATGIEIMESSGVVFSPENEAGTDARYANMTFGQGLSMTAMQLLAAYTAIVNGGTYYRPTLVAGTLKNGVIEENTPEALKTNVVSPTTSATMREMLYKTRSLFADAAGYDMGAYVGGKTGTAQTVNAETGAYSGVTEETIGSYAGFGARTRDDDPGYVIVTKIWDEKRVMEGGKHAKPIFDRISKFMIKYLKWY